MSNVLRFTQKIVSTLIILIILTSGLSPQAASAQVDVETENIGLTILPPDHQSASVNGETLTTNLIQDPSFENSYGTTNGPWQQSPSDTICIWWDPGCDIPGLVGYYSNGAWALFGRGTSTSHAVSQSVRFPKCGAKLEFYLYMGQRFEGFGLDHVFRAMIDNTQVFEVHGWDVNAFRPYQKVSIPVNEFADGASHSVWFYSETGGLDFMYFNLDDVALYPTAPVTSSCAGVSVKIRDTIRGTYGILPNAGERLSYPADSGPVFVNGTNGKSFIASERVIYPKGSNTPTHFSEMMGLPANLKSTRYSFPAYDNIFFNSQLRFANVGTANTTVTVTVGGVVKGNYPLSPNQSTKIGYPGLSGGPVVVQSSGNVPIIASLRVVPLTLNGSYSEIIGVPQSLVGNMYVFPWYNNVNLDTQLRVGNLGPGTTNVTVTVAGVNVGSFTIPLNGSQRLNFANVNNGPVKVTGSAPIVASLRVGFRSGSTWTGFSEIMGLPQSQLDTIYTFPWYNNAGLDTQLRFSNLSASTASVSIYIGGVQMAGSPFSLATGASTRKSFPNVNGGPVKIVSNQLIVASERVLYPKGSNTPTFFSELMGLPQKQLQAATGYIFPWYNNVGLDTQLRIGVP